MDTIQQLKELLQQQFEIDPATVDPDAPFAAYELDSLTLAELVFAIEDSFHVTVSDEAVGSLGTLRDVGRMLDGLLAQKG
jgi:acyl carrier protein